MISSTNPFTRGYENLSVHRLLEITHDDDAPAVYLPLHNSQANLSDGHATGHCCIFSDYFAVITQGQQVPPDLDSQCPRHGTVRRVLYSVMAEEAGEPLHVGDIYSAEAANDMVRRLNFQTGFFSRCWEISSAHITADAFDFLAALADPSSQDRFPFSVFLLNDSPAIGVKLMCTPWTDENLQHIFGTTRDDLLKELRGRELPECLIEVLQLAANADVRMLVFDAHAPVLHGLALHEDE